METNQPNKESLMYKVFSVCAMTMGVVGISTGIRDDELGILILAILSLVGGIVMYRSKDGRGGSQ